MPFRTLFSLALLLSAVAVLALVQSPPAQAAQCVTLKLLDRDGVVVATDMPVIGIMIGGIPAVQGVFPDHATRQPIAEVPCPAELIAFARDVFNASCVTDKMRKKAAAEHNVDAKVIDKGCADLVETLKDVKDPQ